MVTALPILMEDNMMTDFFYIPEHLRREKDGVVIKRRRQYGRTRLAVPTAPFEKYPPRTMKGAEKVAIHLNDHCPRIGSGNRLVWAKTGRKWVHLCDAGGNRGKVSVEIFNSVKKDRVI
jgi:hypothetical protein